MNERTNIVLFDITASIPFVKVFLKTLFTFHLVCLLLQIFLIRLQQEAFKKNFFFILPRFKHDAEGNTEAEEKIRDLVAHAEALEDQADKKSQDMENLLADITEFDAKSGELDGWLADSIKILKTKGGAPRPTRTKVDSLHEAKKEKEGEMEALRQMCEQLVEGDGVKDTFVAKETLADVETKWNDMTELLVQQVSLEVRISCYVHLSSLIISILHSASISLDITVVKGTERIDSLAGSFADGQSLY